MSESSEKLLWNQLRAGNKAALKRIYSSHFEFLYRYGQKFSVDSSTVEDGIQELFIYLWENRARLSETDAIRPYLLVSLRRRLIKAVEKAKKKVDSDVLERHFAAELAIDETMIRSEEDAEMKSKLSAAFKDLSARQQEVLYLRYYAGYDYDLISEVMDMNYQSARNLSSRALQKLRKLMFFISILLWI